MKFEIWLVFHPRELIGEFLQRFLQVLLAQAQCQVGAGAFDDAAHQVGLPPQAVGDGVRVIHGHQHIVDIIHGIQQAFSIFRVTHAQDIQAFAPQLANGLRQSVEVSGIFDPQVFWCGQEGYW